MWTFPQTKYDCGMRFLKYIVTVNFCLCLSSVFNVECLCLDYDKRSMLNIRMYELKFIAHFYNSVCEFSQYMYKIHTCILTYQRYSLYISRAADFCLAEQHIASSKHIHIDTYMREYVYQFLNWYHIMCAATLAQHIWAPRRFITYTHFAKHMLNTTTTN